MKYFIVKTTEGTFRFPASIVAEARAKYYSEVDSDTTYAEEYNYTINDDSELEDWFSNNMDWEDVEKHAQVVAQAGQKFEILDVNIVNIEETLEEARENRLTEVKLREALEWALSEIESLHERVGIQDERIYTQVNFARELLDDKKND
jgi:hypothetical protein